MQSDKYGDIADITRGLRVVTPGRACWSTRAVPATSTGPSVREMILGSEGRLGIITEATVQVHRMPEERDDPRLLLPGLGARAWPPCATSPRATPRRRSPACRTPARRRSRSPPARRGTVARPRQVAGLMTVPAAPRASTSTGCACRSSATRAATAHVEAPAQAGRARSSRSTAASAWARAPACSTTRRSSTRPTSATSCSTAARWPTCRRRRRRGRGCRAVYDGVWPRPSGAFDELGVRGWIMCHLSHSYHSGACLYFTFAFEPAGGDDPPRRSTTW